MLEETVTMKVHKQCKSKMRNNVTWQHNERKIVRWIMEDGEKKKNSFTLLNANTCQINCFNLLCKRNERH
jgi:hypothetical protein